MSDLRSLGERLNAEKSTWKTVFEEQGLITGLAATESLTKFDSNEAVKVGPGWIDRLVNELLQDKYKLDRPDDLELKSDLDALFELTTRKHRNALWSLAGLSFTRLRESLLRFRELVEAADHPDEEVARAARQRCLRLAVLWEAVIAYLRRARDGSNAQPWYPDDRSGLDELLAFDLELPHSTPVPSAVRIAHYFDLLRPRSYSVVFPTELTQEGAEPRPEIGTLFVATVYVFDEPDANDDPRRAALFHMLPARREQKDDKTGNEVDPASLLVAPWSLLPLEAKTCDALRLQLVEKNRPPELALCPKERVMVAFSPLVGSRVVAAQISGMSLSLGVALSLWAARENINLHPFIVTAEIHGDEIRGVKGFAAKLGEINRLRQANRYVDYRVLLRRNDDSDDGDDAKDRDAVEEFKVGRPAEAVYELPATLHELMHPDRKYLVLTDGLSPYRKELIAVTRRDDWVVWPKVDGDFGAELPNEPEYDADGLYFQSDLALLDAAVEPLSHCAGRRPRFKPASDADSSWLHVESIPFDNDPLPAVRYAMRLLARVTATEVSERVHSAPSWTALPVYLKRGSGRDDAQASLTAADLLVDGVQDAAGELSLQDVLSDRIALETILRSSDWSRYCFVVFTDRSNQAGFAVVRRFLEKVVPAARRLASGEANGDARPALLFIAPDHHVKLFIETETTKLLAR